MRELFVIDKKNYNPNGSVGRRPSVRGIILKDEKIAMMYSKKYNYYKLPGGGIESEESLVQTLIREVREESGLMVKPETIKEYGCVRRIEKGRFEDIFIQDNYYFTCETEEVLVEQELEDYELDEEFVLEFVSISHAISVNECSNHFEKEEIVTFRGMLERENRILKILQEEMQLEFCGGIQMNEQVREYIDKYSNEIIYMYDTLRKLIFDSASSEPQETMWAKIPSYYVGESFVRLIPFKDHINIEAKAVSEYTDSLVGYKVTPKGMLQIFLKQEIPVDVLRRIFAETLI